MSKEIITLRSYLCRQQAEQLIDMLEEQPDRILHDKSCLDMAAELRHDFGMNTREEEMKHIKNFYNKD